MDLFAMKEKAKEILDLKEELNKAIISGWEMGMFINIAITQREAVVGKIHDHPCPILNMGVAADPLKIEDPPVTRESLLGLP